MLTRVHLSECVFTHSQAVLKRLSSYGQRFEERRDGFAARLGITGRAGWGTLGRSKVGNALRGLCRDIRPVRHVDVGSGCRFI